MLKTQLDNILNSQALSFPEQAGQAATLNIIGKPIAGNADYDPLNLYVPGVGLSLTVSDYVPNHIIKGFTVATAGDVNVTYYNGVRETISVTSKGDESPIFPGFLSKIHKDGTTATGIKPLF